MLSEVRVKSNVKSPAPEGGSVKSPKEEPAQISIDATFLANLLAILTPAQPVPVIPLSTDPPAPYTLSVFDQLSDVALYIETFIQATFDSTLTSPMTSAMTSSPRGRQNDSTPEGVTIEGAILLRKAVLRITSVHHPMLSLLYRRIQVSDVIVAGLVTS